MLVSFQVFERDTAQLIRLLQWCAKLDTYKQHQALIVADAATPYPEILKAMKIAGSVFGQVHLVTNEQTVIGWVEGPKSLFLTTAEWAAKHGTPFLVMETDCVPLRRGWLYDIDQEYRLCGARYMGHIYECKQVGLPPRLMSGVGVYSPDVIELAPMIEAGANWDVAMTEGVLPHAHHTKLIHHLWGGPNRVPTFARKALPPDVFGIDQLPDELALWHRNKDGTLIRLLERKFFPDDHKARPIVVCFNVHAGDIDLAILHSEWLRKMAKRNERRAYICHDPSCPVTKLNQLEANLRWSFVDVETFVYPRPPIPQYPASANWSFQSTAHKMATQQSPWLWMEADAIALKPDWLDQLQAVYEREGCAFMGPVVPGMGHMNGGAIYPPDASTRMPRAMACASGAWDMEGKEDMGADRHDAMPLMFHLWTLLNRMAHPVGGGDLPTNITADEIRRWLPREAVYVHRLKDRSVLDLLLSGAFVP